MPPPRRRKVKSLAESEGSVPAKMVVEASSGEDSAVSPTDGSPLRRKVRLRSPPLAKSGGFVRFTDSSESSSSSSETGDTTDTVKKGGDAKMSVDKGGEVKAGRGVGRVNEGGKEIGVSSNMVKKKNNKGGNREFAKGAVAVGGSAVSHVAAVKRITGELSGLVFGDKKFELETVKGLMELAS